MAREKQESSKVTKQPRLMNVAVIAIGRATYRGRWRGLGAYLKCGSLPLTLVEAKVS